MKRHDSFIGGEGNGGVIDSRIVGGRDSLVGMAYVLQLMAETGKSISQLVDDVPKYAIVKDKFECRRDDAERAAAAVATHFEKRRGASRSTFRTACASTGQTRGSRPVRATPSRSCA